jgi:hypothetical protein
MMVDTAKSSHSRMESARAACWAMSVAWPRALIAAFEDGLGEDEYNQDQEQAEGGGEPGFPRAAVGGGIRSRRLVIGAPRAGRRAYLGVARLGRCRARGSRSRRRSGPVPR